jgi:hypothetical protein
VHFLHGSLCEAGDELEKLVSFLAEIRLKNTKQIIDLKAFRPMSVLKTIAGCEIAKGLE